jgi:hypothetical protein
MAIKIDDAFEKKLKALEENELEKLGKQGKYEVGVYFENYILHSLSFNYTSSEWSDNYWIFFPNPEKLKWEDVHEALRTGFKYLSENQMEDQNPLSLVE